nr:putative glycine-rich cell wall structural protein 1 [Arachis hypogaea]
MVALVVAERRLRCRGGGAMVAWWRAWGRRRGRGEKGERRKGKEGGGRGDGGGGGLGRRRGKGKWGFEREKEKEKKRKRGKRGVNSGGAATGLGVNNGGGAAMIVAVVASGSGRLEGREKNGGGTLGGISNAEARVFTDERTIREQLDRWLISTKPHEEYLSASMFNLDDRGSDHKPLLLCTDLNMEDELAGFYVLEERYLKEKSRINWLK